MGSDAHLILVDPHPRGCASALDRLQELESRWSRFIADSELSRCNTAGGSWTRVSNDTLVLVAAMKEAAEQTGGRYDPTFLHELLQLGYTASLDDPDRVSVMIDLPCPGLSVHDVEVDPAAGRIRLPEGLALDPGGIGKGLAADIIVGELLDAGTAGALVSIGGDLSAAGTPPDGAAWRIELADPDPLRAGLGAEPLMTFTTTGGGVATSSTQARRSVRDGVSRHHIIDPTTRCSADTDLATVTVVTDCGWRAEAHATAALMAGGPALRAYAETHGLTAIGVGIDGALIEVGIGADGRDGGAPAATSSRPLR